MYMTSLVSNPLGCPTLIPVSNDGCKASNQEYLGELFYKCIPGNNIFDTTNVQCILIAYGSRGISQH